MIPEVKSSKRALAALLNLALMLSLALALPAQALGRETGGDVGTSDRFPQPSGEDVAEAPASEPPPIDCSKPIPGKRTTLGVDDEILVAFAGQSNVTEIAKFDNTSNSDATLKYFWTWESSKDDEYDFYQPRSIALTTADLDLDGKAEVISAIGNNNPNPGVLEVVSIKNPEASGGDLAYDLWTSSSHNRQGYGMGYLMAAAAGDLNAKYGDNASEEVVVAFQDGNKNLQVVLLDGEPDGGIHEMAYWISSDHYRYDMSDIAAAVGDLDGDGIDDEIVLALSDGYEVLQLIVLEYNGHGGLTELAYQRYIGANQVDVTTGVFSGNGKDQVAVAFEDGNKNLHAGVFEYNASAGSVASLAWWYSNAQDRDHVDYVSVASGDIDGDKWDEIIIAFADRSDNFQAVTLDSDANGLKFHSSAWGVNAAFDISEVSVDAGDIDGDGKAEVVATFSDYNSSLQMLSFDDKSSCPCPDDGAGLQLRDQRQDWRARFTRVALGDVDGNNLYGDYTGQCEEIDETRLIAIMDRPPYWENLNDNTEVGYGNSIKGGDEEENHITNSYGGSVTFDSSFDFGEFEIGSSFTKEWEHSTTQTWTQGTSLETIAGWTSPEDGLVPINTVTYYTYQYRKRDGSGLARVSIPVSAQTDAKRMTFWNELDGARDMFPDSWVPAYRTAWQDHQTISALSDFSSDDLFWGEGADVYDFNGNGKPDYLFAVIVGTQNGGNNVFYRIGYDVSLAGVPATISPWIPIWNSLGNRSSGLGVAVSELNGNNTPDLVVAWVDDPAGENNAYYRVSWDLAANGHASSMSDWKQIPGPIGAVSGGAGLDLVDLNGNGRPELIFGWIDESTGAGMYTAGWDLNENGDTGNGWSASQEIGGAFGSQNAGLGLTVDDLDGDDQPELLAAWAMRDGNGDWALSYAAGESLDENGAVASWAPQPSIPGALANQTGGVSLASASLVAGNSEPELMTGWISSNRQSAQAELQVAKYWQLGGEVDQRPTDIDDPDTDDGLFRIELFGNWWQSHGKLLWRWDETENQNGNDLAPIYVSVGGADPYWKVDRSQFSEYSTESSESYNYEVGGGATFLGIGGEGSRTWGFEEGHSDTVSWETGLLLDGQSQGLPDHTPWSKEYKYVPFTYMQEATSRTGIKQAYMVLDYFVPWRGSAMAQAPDTNGLPSAAPAAAGVAATSPEVAPGVPLVASPSHPDPGAWYASDNAIFTWTQPAGDPAVVDGYRWYLDHSPDTAPAGMSFGLTNTVTFETLSDGQWWLHVRARDDDGDWSETGHRVVRVDANPPQVELALDPPLPVDKGGWYNGPVTVTIQTDDGTGSGVQSIEFSADGLSWQPYSAPLVFATETPIAPFQARASDMAGHVSAPVSVTFGVDLSLPTSLEGPACWQPGGACLAGVYTDTVGNQRLRLRGQLDGSLSGQVGLGIEIDGGGWATADEVGEGLWSFTSDRELGAGCHTFAIQGEDWAGNLESLHAFGDEVVWHPQERPILAGGSLSVVPDLARPGDVVSIDVVAPNSSWQEMLVPISVTLPVGLDVLSDTISSDGVYDPAARTITWPPRHLWPGQERRLAFDAQADEALPAAELTVALSALGTWPIAPTCPPDALPGFRDLEETLAIETTLIVNPSLPNDGDVRPPATPFLRIREGAVTNHRNVHLLIEPVPDARWMYLREWAWSEIATTWIPVQESGWLSATTSLPWTLSEEDGVKYVGIWLADLSWNVSPLEPRSLAFTSLVTGNQTLTDGRRIQYRFPLVTGDLAVFNVIAKVGNPDLYVWEPFSGFRPQYAATGSGYVDTVAFPAARPGLYLIEIKAEGDSRYQLLLSGDIGPGTTAAAKFTANTPEHPLTVSDPLSAGMAVAPAVPRLYLPLMTKN